MEGDDRADALAIAAVARRASGLILGAAAVLASSAQFCDAPAQAEPSPMARRSETPTSD